MYEYHMMVRQVIKIWDDLEPTRFTHVRYDKDICDNLGINFTDFAGIDNAGRIIAMLKEATNDAHNVLFSQIKIEKSLENLGSIVEEFFGMMSQTRLRDEYYKKASKYSADLLGILRDYYGLDGIVDGLPSCDAQEMGVRLFRVTARRIKSVYPGLSGDAAAISDIRKDLRAVADYLFPRYGHLKFLEGVLGYAKRVFTV